MKIRVLLAVFAFTFLVSCNKDKEILNTLNEYNTSMESKGYHFGDRLNLPKEVTDNAEKQFPSVSAIRKPRIWWLIQNFSLWEIMP
jgi:hypothetical protein